MLDSEKFSLNTNDFVVLAKNAALVGLAAGLTYVGENVSNLDLGNAGVMLVPVVVVVIDTVVKWAKNNSSNKWEYKC